MKLKDIQQLFHIELDLIFDTTEVDSFFYLLTEAYFDIDRMFLALNPEVIISKQEETLLFKALSKLKKQQPIQYILKKADFFGIEFKVNKHTLIPRPETEDIVRLIIDNQQPTKVTKILDIGTGGGCIAISLAKNIANSKVTAIDISKKALKIAKKNAKKNKVNIKFLKIDVFDKKAEKFDNTFDIIVSNPPYVRDSEKSSMHPNVLQYEPKIALFVSDQEPLIYYDRIATIALTNLSNKGKLYFEINQYLGNQMQKLLKNKGFKNVLCSKDIFGNDRIISATL